MDLYTPAANLAESDALLQSNRTTVGRQEQTGAVSTSVEVYAACYYPSDYSATPLLSPCLRTIKYS